MDKRIIINVTREGLLTVFGTPMSVAEMNLWLDLAKKNLLDQGKADGEIEAPSPEQAHLLLHGGNGSKRK